MAKSSKADATYRTASRRSTGAENIASISAPGSRRRLAGSCSFVAVSKPEGGHDDRNSGRLLQSHGTVQTQNRTVDVRARGGGCVFSQGDGRLLQHFSTNRSHATIRNP